MFISFSIINLLGVYVMPEKNLNVENALETELKEINGTPDWSELSAMPNKYSLTLFRIHGRVLKSISTAKGKSEKNFLEKTATEIRLFAEKLNEDFKPAPQKDIQDAFNYALSRKFEATYIALLDENENLVKVLILERKIWSERPTIEINERSMTVAMKAKFLTIAQEPEFGKTDANLDGGKAIPKRVMSAVPFACNRDKILEYKEV
jgi:hypothetical protein